MAYCSASPKLGGGALEEQSSYGRTEDESMEATADQAALANTLSSSALEYAEAGDRPPLYRALDTLRVTPKPLEKTPLPNLGAPVRSLAPEAESTPRPPNRQLHARPRAAASLSGGLAGPRIVLLTCGAATLLGFAAAAATVAIVTARSSDELRRSMNEVERVLQVNTAAMRSTALSSAVTRGPHSASSMASPSGEAHNSSRNWLDSTGSSF
ncbi:uncharacterized protein LOC144127486 [Amblyomma americanum]